MRHTLSIIVADEPGELSRLVAPLEYHAMVEFVNRTITGLVSVAVMLAVLTAVNLAAARGGIKADLVAVDGLRDLLDARAVRVVREGPEGDLVVAQAGQLDAQLDLDRLPHLDEEGRIPAGHRRSVGGTLVLPAEGAVVDLVRRDRRVGSLDGLGP